MFKKEINSNTKENFKEDYKKLIRIVRIIVLIRFITLISILIYSIKSGMYSSEALKITTTISGTLFIIHILFGYKLLKTYKGILEDDKSINIIVLIEGFIFAGLLGLILTLLAKRRQREYNEINDPRD